MTDVWVVDDDDEMRDAIQLMLKVIGVHATVYTDARAAAQSLLGGKRPDLLILDINMPEVSGLDLLEFVRRRPEWSRLPVLMLSTEAADVTVDRAMFLGADGYVTKPVTMEELQRALDAALQKSRKGFS
jgi:two-component system chemotaxis response regulator CheY